MYLHRSSEIGNGHIFVPIIAYSAIIQGTWTGYGQVGLDNTTTKAINDELNFITRISPGTWSMRLSYNSGADYGIIKVDTVGVAAGNQITQDAYDAVGAAYNLVTKTGILVTSTGLMTIRVRSDSKNALSTAYHMILHGISLWRTA